MPASSGNGKRNDGITRRDFLDGVAITSAGLAVAAANPGMTGAQVRLKKGGVAWIETGELLVLLRPAELRALGGS